MSLSREGTDLVIPGGKGVTIHGSGVYGRGKTVVICRAYLTDTTKDRDMGLITPQIDDFVGVSIGDRLTLAPGVRSNQIINIERKLTGTKIEVYRCKTSSGSYYDIVAIK